MAGEKPPTNVGVTVYRRVGEKEEIRITPEGFFEPGEIEAFSYGLPEVKVRGHVYKMKGTPSASGDKDSSRKGFRYLRDF
jgi:hypothetical protein